MQATQLKNGRYTSVSSGCDMCNIAVKELEAQIFHATQAQRSVWRQSCAKLVYLLHFITRDVTSFIVMWLTAASLKYFKVTSCCCLRLVMMITNACLGLQVAGCDDKGSLNFLEFLPKLLTGAVNGSLQWSIV